MPGTLSRALGSFPTRVGDLGMFETRIRCPQCGRLTVLDVGRLKLSERTLLTELLSKLQCSETRGRRKCGGKPEALEIRYRPARTPHFPEPAAQLFSMDGAGVWTEGGHDIRDAR